MDEVGPQSIEFGCSFCGARVITLVGSEEGHVRCELCGTSVRVPELVAYDLSPKPAPADTPRRVPQLAVRKGKPAGRMREAWHATARETSVLEKEILLLTFLSVADVLTTYYLLRAGPRFYESNPVARFFFARWNIAGMAIFKFSVIGFVVLVGELAERKRPGMGRFVLAVGCLATLAVVFQGLRLAVGTLAD